MTDWKEIKDEGDIKDLMELYGYFHDACLREIHITTTTSVDETLSMGFDETQAAILLFQRQSKNLRVIELKFERTLHLNFTTYNSTIIFDATFKKVDGVFYWADDKNWEIDDNDCLWVSAKEVFWRERPELIGPVNRMKNQ